MSRVIHSKYQLTLHEVSMSNHHKQFVTTAFFSIFGILISALVIMAAPLAFAAPTPVDLATAKPFAILAGTPGISDAGNASVITGNVGLSPASGSGIGLNCPQVIGVIYSTDAAGPALCRVTNAPLLTTAKSDLTAAFVDVAGRTPLTTVPTELGGTTKIAGIYDSGSTTFTITAGSGPLVLDGQNDPSSVFIFEMGFSGTGLTAGPGSVVSLINGAQACNVYWRVDTAFINTTAAFKGNVLALNSISVANGATIEGRLLARNGSVSLINDTITVPACTVVPTGSGSGSGGTTTTGTTTGSSLLAPNTGAARDYSSVLASFVLSILALGFIVVTLYRFVK
jgi:hypothetical protein